MNFIGTQIKIMYLRILDTTLNVRGFASAHTLPSPSVVNEVLDQNCFQSVVGINRVPDPFREPFEIRDSFSSSSDHNICGEQSIFQCVLSRFTFSARGFWPGRVFGISAISYNLFLQKLAHEILQ